MNFQIVFANNTKPWRYQTPPTTPPNLPTNPKERAIALTMAGYNQGTIFPYAPNFNIIHCPSDTRYTRPVNLGFAFCSMSPVATLNGEQTELLKRTDVLHPSARYLWLEENDPRGENLGSWEFNAGSGPPDFTGSGLIDSTAANHQTTRRELLLTASRLAQHIAILELPLDQFEDARIADRPG